MSRSLAGRGAFGADPIRRPAVVVIAGATAAFWAVAAGTTGTLSAYVETTLAPGPDWPATLATAATFLGPVAATALAAHVAGGGRPRRFAVGYALLVGPALSITLLAPLAPSGWWLVAAVALLGLAMASLPPAVVPRAAPTRRLQPAERATLGRLLADGDDAVTPDGVRVRVLALGPTGPATALAAGVLPVPGGRVVFVTERVLSTLPGPEARAIVAHELGHHRRRHVPLRLGSAAAFLLPWLAATAAGLPGAFLGGLVLAVPAVVGLFRLVRWTEFDADSYAADVVGAEPMARALERLAAGGALAAGGGPLSLHPSPADRVARLRGEDGTADDVESVPGDD
jgi:STE24 endopeptidase